MNQAKAASMHSELELTRERKYAMPENVPWVVIVGGGFAGLARLSLLEAEIGYFWREVDRRGS
jgi:hypothetical protein